MGIHVLVVGGLGNQMLTIFTGIAYFLDNKVPFKLVSAERKRPFYYNTLLNNVKRFVDDDPSSLKNKLVYEEPHFHYKKIPYNDNFILKGYWQSHKYFKHQLDNILRMTGIDKKRGEVKMKYGYKENSISIHFRIGDYKNITEYHNILSISYYVDALIKIRELDDNVNNVIIFGEEVDNDIISERFNILKNMFPELYFEKIDYTIEDYEQMLIMSNCKYNIIANSSFSLMAAYLNSNKDKKVLYPRKWFGPKYHYHNTDDIPEHDWLCIEN